LHEITSEIFQKKITGSHTPFLVFIWAPWCGNCKALKPIIEEISNEMEKNFEITSLNGDESKDFIKKYKVFGLPTLLIFIHGRLVNRKTGIQSKKSILKKIEENMDMTAEEAKKNEITGLFRWPIKRSKN
jgi:thioredoxin